MSCPTFKHTVTLYHQYKETENNRSVTKWSKSVHENCYFGTETVKQVNGTTLSMASSFVCRIPQNAGNSDTLIVSPGDIIIKGRIEDEIADVMGQRSSDLLNKYRGTAFTVKEVSDNSTLPYAPHYRASGV